MNAVEYNIAVTDYADRLYGFVYKNMGIKEDAKDIVQNTFIVLWENKQQVTEDKCKAYLFQVAYNKTIDHFRKHKRITLKEEFNDNSNGSILTDSNMLKQALDKGLRLLSEQERTLVLLKDYEGYNYAEIGEITNLNESQVKVYLMRARLKLKEILIQQGIKNEQ
jgi:RNA polymerase sigma-70 factor (ECF subfamily)